MQGERALCRQTAAGNAAGAGVQLCLLGKGAVCNRNTAGARLERTGSPLHRIDGDAAGAVVHFHDVRFHMLHTDTA